MSSYYSTLTSSQVQDPLSFSRWSHQTIGTKQLTAKELPSLGKSAQQFFEANQRATWMTLCHTIQWCKAKKRRLALPQQVFTQVPWAYKDGALPELDPRNHDNNDHTVEDQIEAIIERETDGYWQGVFARCAGTDNRRAALRRYQNEKVLARA